MTGIAQAPMQRVMRRLDTAWQAYATPHILVLAQSGAGKTTLARLVLALRPQARVVVFLPKTKVDASWADGPGAPRPVGRLGARFGEDGDGGGPHGRWYLRMATASIDETTRIMREDIALLMAEGHAIVVLDDARALASTYGLHRELDDLVTNGRSAGLSVLTCSQDTAWLPGKAQYPVRLLGHAGSAEAARKFAAFLPAPFTGQAWARELDSTPRLAFVYADTAAPAIAAPARFAMPAGL